MKASFWLAAFWVLGTHALWACHLQTHLGPAAGTDLGDQALALVSRYVEPVEPIPFDGIKPGGCLYQVTFAQSGDQTQASIQGPRLNGLGFSEQKGPAGWTRALLAALMLGQESAARRERICADYGEQLPQRCRKIEADLALFDELGRPLADGAQVRSGERFYLSLRPLSELYAKVYSRDSAGRFFELFPNRQLSSLSNPLQAGQVVSLPDGGRMLAFDRKPGQEHFYLVFSGQPLEGLKSESTEDETFSRQLESQGSGRWVGDRRFAGRGTFVVHWVFEHR